MHRECRSGAVLHGPYRLKGVFLDRQTVRPATLEVVLAEGVCCCLPLFPAARETCLRPPRALLPKEEKHTTTEGLREWMCGIECVLCPDRVFLFEVLRVGSLLHGSGEFVVW